MQTADPWAPRTERGANRGYALLGAVLVSILGIAVGFVFSGVVIFGTVWLGVDLSLLALVAVVFVTTAIGFVATGTAYLSLRGISIRTYVSVRAPGFGDLLWVVGGYVAALSLVFVAGILLTILQVAPETTNQAAELGMENPELLLWLVPLSILVVAPGEELLFRGVVQGRLREGFEAKVAIPVTAALFASVHYFSLTGAAEARLMAIAILFVPSLVFGYAYERSMNLLVPILIHGLYNSTLVLVLYVVIETAGNAPV
ncbi:MAG: type II CAAX endopeptidase family protein [Halodesulfurarchaeum sp.]|nr:type II CAAX endopeptidase family protein [Halodesulfurarchaeum sp.]